MTLLVNAFALLNIHKSHGPLKYHWGLILYLIFHRYESQDICQTWHLSNFHVFSKITKSDVFVLMTWDVIQLTADLDSFKRVRWFLIPSRYLNPSHCSHFFSVNVPHRVRGDGNKSLCILSSANIRATTPSRVPGLSFFFYVKT